MYVEVGGNPSPLDGARYYRIDVPTSRCTLNYTDDVYRALEAVGAVPAGSHPYPNGAGELVPSSPSTSPTR